MLTTVGVLGAYLYLRLDDEVRRYAEGVLSAHYSHLEVKVGSARFEPGRGVMLRNLTIREPIAGGTSRPLAEVEEMQLLGTFDCDALTSGSVAIQRIRLRSPRVHAIRKLDGTWNIASLFPPPSTGNHPADIEVVGAAILVTDVTSGSTKPLKLHEVSMTAKCIEQSPAATPDALPFRTYQVEASVGGDLAEQFKFAGRFQTGSGAFQTQAELVGLDLSSPLVKSLVSGTRQMSKVTEVNGRADVSLTAARPAGRKLTWQANFHLAGGRLVLDGVPKPFSNISATGIATEDRLLVQQADANFGKASIVLALDRRGWDATAALAMQARADRLMVDESLLEFLPPAAAKAWARFQPHGEITATLAAQFDGQRWKPDLTVECHDAAFTDKEKFDYRLTGATGKFTVGDHGDGRGPVLDIEQFTATVDNTPVTIRGSFAGLPGLGAQRALGGDLLPPTGWLQVEGKRIAINDSVVDALGPKVRRIVDSLDAKGRVSIHWRFERTDPLANPHTETDLTFHNARVQFEKFPYPLSNIEGQAIERDGNWQFQNLVSRGANAPRVVHATGTCNKQPDGTHVLSLAFVGEQIPLDDTLRLALPAAHRETWSAVGPVSGRVNLTAQIVHHLGVDDRPRMRLEVQPLPQVVSIEPKCFPYRLDNLQGTIVVDNQQVTLAGLRAEHGATIFETRGSWTPNNRGGWTLQFDDLTVDRLSADYDLKRASPAGIGKVLEHLKPVGTFSIYDGTVRFSRDMADSTHLRSDWRVTIGLQQNDLELGVPLRSISGSVQLAGRHESNLRFAAGQLDLDSVFWNGMQFTSVRGPLWVDTEECRLGREATRRMNANNARQDELQRIEANLYGGKLVLDAGVQLSSGSRYVVDLAIDQCDLARMSTDYFGGTVDLSGTLSGQATINGMGRSLDLLDGGGRMAIRNAKMYELPVMARLLKVLRLREPDKTAFNGVDAQFDIDGKYVQFDELNLLGDAVSLYGKGLVTFDRQLDLKFHSTVGRNDFRVPMLRSMIGQASANLLLINVTGPMENAKVERDPFPAVNEFVEQLGGDGVASPPPPRGFWNR